MSSEKSGKKTFGQRGEAFALNYLKGRGYTIVATNWRCKHGEIDIIAWRGEMLVFVEVRTRRADLPETAFESITERKRQRLAALAQTYISMHQLEHLNWRVDVIAIAIPPSGQPALEHAEDALGW